ncbi:hypothetical protein HNY73_003269 [Argiope bruennichi]|uniref:Uncharacterized protein n=1 Tax=Argiope bruennichi TaxID=94029 RepID=A0A8T0G0R6_ARGBR|nr:hypothetical protein HNY73_003269 [Argiope bruennichi]
MATEADDIFVPNVEEEDSNIEACHKYDRSISILDALSVEEFEEDLDFKTRCDKSSSWEIILKLEKEVPFNNFNIFVTLRRIDFSDYPVEGILVIWFLNIEGKKCPVSYRLNCEIDGRGAKHDVFAVDAHYRCLLREEDYFTFPDDVLMVKVQLFVRGCCRSRSKYECCPKFNEVGVFNYFGHLVSVDSKNISEMPVIDGQSVSVKTKVFDNGHTVNYTLVGLNFRDNDIFRLNQEYKTKCSAFITLWKIGIKFQKESSTNTVSCILTAKRDDPLLCQVAANFSIELFSADLERLVGPIILRKTSVQSGEVVEKRLDELISSEIISSNGEDLNVKIAFNVYYCH